MNGFTLLNPRKRKMIRQLIVSPMNDKNRFRFTTLVLLGFLIILLLVGLFKTSYDLRSATRLLKNAADKAEESSLIVRHQDSLLRELMDMNQKISWQIRQMDSVNQSIQREMNLGFRSATRNISNIRETLDKITVPQIK